MKDLEKSAGGFIFQKKIDSLYSSERLNHSLPHAILCKESILESDNGEGESGLLWKGKKRLRLFTLQ